MFIKHQIVNMLSSIAILLPAFLVIFSFRGLVRTLVAQKMGDDSAANDGFATLNPAQHIDIVGLIIMLSVVFFVSLMLKVAIPRQILFVFLILMGIRLRIPPPFDPNNFHNMRRGAILTILAFPAASILLGFLFLYVKKCLYLLLIFPRVKSTLLIITEAIIDLSLFCGVMDFLPIPPFDGGKILQYILPASKQNIALWLEENSFIIIVVLFLVPGINRLFLMSISFFALVLKILLSRLIF